MAQHTAKQWRELVEKLTALRDNPNEHRDKRAKADEILRSISGDPEAQQALRSRVPDTGTTMSGWDGFI